MNRTTSLSQDGSSSRRRRGSVLLALFAGFLLAVTPLQAASPNEKANESCLGCHSDKDMVKEVPNGTPVSLFVDADRFGKAVHASIACKTCHADIHKDHPNDGNPVPKVNCGNCHTDESKIYLGSIHGVSRAMGSSAAANCVDCHGNHYIGHVS